MHELNPSGVVARVAFHKMALKFVRNLFTKFSQCGKAQPVRCLGEQRRDGVVDPPFRIIENDDAIPIADMMAVRTCWRNQVHMLTH